jgi:geranylgeranyl diphosphate synthase type II
MSTAPSTLHELSDPTHWMSERIERALRRAIDGATGQGTPPRLREALRHAVFPGGARLRPRLCLAVAEACGADHAQRLEASAVAVELVHCASLVHDDMPCFDDAPLRRGRPTVHRVFGEPTALLVGDALIVLAFGTLGAGGAGAEIAVLAEATGPSRGIIAGQAWESEVAVQLDEYHRAKTASLFDAAAGMGAMAAGIDPTPWRAFGETVGRAYQAADDLADALGDAARLGKLPGRDAVLGRPSLVRAHGIESARRRTEELLAEARRRLPSCADETLLLRWLDSLGERVGLS